MKVSFLERDTAGLRMRDLRFFKVIAILTVFLWLFEVLFPTWRILPLVYGQSTVPLHYNVHLGVDSIGEWWKIYLTPGIGLLFIAVNVVVAKMTWKKERMLAYLVAASTVVMQIMLCIAMVCIVLLNISYV
jgi:hypothetical protein